jgi:hypothetical protein
MVAKKLVGALLNHYFLETIPCAFLEASALVKSPLEVLTILFTKKGKVSGFQK